MPSYDWYNENIVYQSEKWWRRQIFRVNKNENIAIKLTRMPTMKLEKLLPEDGAHQLHHDTPMH